MSKKTFNPKDWASPNTTAKTATKPLVCTNPKTDIETVTARIEAAAVDIIGVINGIHDAVLPDLCQICYKTVESVQQRARVAVKQRQIKVGFGAPNSPRVPRAQRRPVIVALPKRLPPP